MNEDQKFENSNLLLGDLSDVGVELGSDELAAVSGAMRKQVSWTCGTPEKADEWTIG